MRLDNVIFRLGLADSRAQARQMVRHGHIMVNGRKSSIPSSQVRVNDIIGWSQRGKKSEYYKVVEETAKSKIVPTWLARDDDTLTGRVVRAPEPDRRGRALRSPRHRRVLLAVSIAGGRRIDISSTDGSRERRRP